MNGTTTGGAHEPPRGARAMNVLRWVLFGALVVLAAASVTGYVLSRGGGGSSAAAKASLYRCPMHPTYTSPRPAECPICGMDLEPVQESDSASGASDVAGLVPVTISPARVQRIGVRTAIARRAPLGEGLELTGFVAPDESRLRVVQLRVSGWVRDLAASRTGETLRAGQPMLTLYSPELYQSEREYLLELGSGTDAGTPHGGASHEAGAARAGRERLALLGVPEGELARLERERTAAQSLVLRAPVTGTLLERQVVEGQYVGPETPLFTIADLSRVWVMADVYAMDVARVHVGDPVSFEVDGLPGRAFTGRIDFVAPTVSSETRTVQARIALANGDGALKPGMFGRVRIEAHGRAVLTVPSEAVIRTGREDYVFLARAGGLFEPRRVRVGAEADDRAEILSGLAAGDTVVASASFLIDSESRLKAAIEGLGSQPGAAAPAAGTPPAHGH